IVLAPSKSQELYDFTMEAFDLADKYRIPVIILADGFLGQMMEPVEIKKRVITPLPPKDWIVDGCRGREKRNVASYCLSNEIGEAACLKLQTKYEQIKENEQQWEEYRSEDAQYLLVGYGTCGRIAKSVVLNARKQGIKLGLIRPLTLWPFPDKAFAPYKDKVKGIVTVELNAGQMIEDVKLAVECRMPVHLYSRQGGIMPGAKEIFDFTAKVFEWSAAEEASTDGKNI
ncbi:MAG: 3-methyl-2-oxobutanoate dehydrogenase subunit beta, partial [Sporomusaceae bacterium]|nr:3-methyl-2-oxobutanoate dehydrogenase subunit beta [Sporomusaceae bacterium]